MNIVHKKEAYFKARDELDALYNKLVEEKFLEIPVEVLAFFGGFTLSVLKANGMGSDEIAIRLGRMLAVIEETERTIAAQKIEGIINPKNKG